MAFFSCFCLPPKLSVEPLVRHSRSPRLRERLCSRGLINGQRQFYDLLRDSILRWTIRWSSKKTHFLYQMRQLTQNAPSPHFFHLTLQEELEKPWNINSTNYVTLHKRLNMPSWYLRLSLCILKHPYTSPLCSSPDTAGKALLRSGTTSSATEVTTCDLNPPLNDSSWSGNVRSGSQCSGQLTRV